MKSIRLGFLLACACLSASPLAPRAHAQEFTHAANPDGSLTLTGHSRPEGSLAFPAAIDGTPVTAIATEAFAHATGLTEIHLPDSITDIDPQAFAYCSGLTNITLGARVARIGEWAFRGCTRLASVNVAPANPHFSSVNGILFNRDQTRLLLFPAARSGSYDIPPSVLEIGNDAFARTAALTNLAIPSGVTRIGSWAFDRSGLAHVALPDTVSTLGTGAFSGCSRLQFIALGTGLSRIEPRTFERCGLLAIDLPSPIEAIDDWAFFNCLHLAQVTLPPSLRSLGNRAFQGCASLARIVLPASVRTLGEEALSDCPALTEVVCEGHAPEAGPDLFNGSDQAVTTYFSDTTGWNSPFGGRPAVPAPPPKPEG